MEIKKVSDKEYKLELGPNDHVTKSHVTVDDLYDHLGKHLEAKKSGKPIADGCGLQY